MTTNRLQSLKVLCAKTIALEFIKFDREQVPSDLHPVIDRYQGKIFSGDDVHCPKCKEYVMIYITNDTECTDETYEWVQYCSDLSVFWEKDEDVLKFYCLNCDVLSLACPKCSSYDLTKEVPMEQVTDRAMVLTKYIGFRNDASESLPMRPNHPPNDDDLNYDDDRRADDYANAPPISPDEIDNIEQEAEFEYIDYYRGHEHRHWATIDDMSTGPDGGFPVYWRCEFCDHVIEMNDK